MYDIAIIGCGIVGAAVAYELSRYDIKIAILEKENDVAVATTKANSAIIHAGFDPTPGTLMAKLNARGNLLAKEIFKTLDISHKECGALVLAFSQEEVEVLQKLLQNGRQNGVPGMKILKRDEIMAREPNINPDVVAALHAPTTMIVSPWEFGLAMAETAVVNGATLYLECEVADINKTAAGYDIKTNQGNLKARYVINAAGLFADRVNNMIMDEKLKIIPDRGEYFLLDKNEGTRVSSAIFQCPTDAGKGVLVAPTVHGNLIVGPNSVEADEFDNVATTAVGLDFVRNLAAKSVPGIDFRANIRNFAGLRAKTKTGDFIIEATDGFVNLAGISSPGLSAAPAIAKMAVELLGETFPARQNFVNTREITRFNKLSHAEKGELVASDPAYATIICRCETVTEGEIRDALRSPIPPRSLDAVKRRTGAGMGRCQSGFCGPRVVEILAEHYQCCPTEILQDGAGTFILVEETKGVPNDKL